MFRDALTMARKEGLDATRDRRAMFAAFAYALFGPIVLAAVLNAMARDELTEPERLLRVENGQAAPALMTHLESQGFLFADDAPIVLTVPEDFTSRVAAGKPVTLTALLEVAGNERELADLQASIEGWERTVATQRLLARGMSPAVVQPLRLDIADAGALSARGKAVMSMLVLFLILAPFFASTSVAIDATSGERERGSLEALLALPARASSTIAGKWLVTAAVALVGTALTVAVGAVVVNRAPLADLGVRLFVDMPAGLLAVAALAPLAMLVGAVQLLISLAARSFKEGQTYLTLFSFLPVFVGLMATRSDAPVAPGIPVLTEMKLLEGVLTTGRVDVGMLAGTAAIYAVLAASALVAATWRIERENILADG